MIRYAHSKGFHVLVMEDDIILDDNFDLRFEMAFKHLPFNWDLLYLGGNEVIKGSAVSSQLKSVVKMTGGFGVLVNKACYPQLIALMEGGKLIADYNYMELQSRNRSFATLKPLILHKEGRFSEIKGRVVDY